MERWIKPECFVFCFCCSYFAFQVYMLASCCILMFLNALNASSWKMFWLKEFCDRRFSIVFGICFIMFGGWLDSTFIYYILLSGLWYGLYVPSFRLLVIYRLSTIFCCINDNFQSIFLKYWFKVFFRTF